MTRPDHPIPAHDGEALERLTFLAKVMQEHWDGTPIDLTILAHDCETHAADLRTALALISTQERLLDLTIEAIASGRSEPLYVIRDAITAHKQDAALLTKGQSHG